MTHAEPNDPGGDADKYTDKQFADKPKRNRITKIAVIKPTRRIRVRAQQEAV